MLDAVEAVGRVKFLFRFFTLITMILTIPALGRAEKADSLRILVLGDSLSAGYGLQKAQAWPAVLEQKLLNRFPGRSVKVVNAGVSGETSTQLLARVDWALGAGLEVGQKWNWVVVGIGANDGLRFQPVAQLRKNLGMILAKVKKSGARVLLLGMKLPTSLEANYRISFEKVYSDLGASKAVAVFDPFFLEPVAARPELNLDDQIHPNARGHELLAERVLLRLWPLIEGSRTK